MLDFFTRFFDAGFMPHGHCYRWEPDLLWLHAGSDSAIALAYYTIPLLLVYIVRRRRDLAFPWMFVMFGAFIVLCGTTHVLEVWSIWNGAYWMTGTVKAVTGVVSLATAAALVPLVPRVLALVGPEQLKRVNDSLLAEIAARRQVEQQLRQRNRDLAERTAQVRRLASELTLAEQRERRDLAQVLHDDLQQTLYGVQLKLKMARPEAASAPADVAARLTDADALLLGAIETTRRLTVDLSPVVLDGAGLDEALRWLVVYMDDRFGLQVDLRADDRLTVLREDMRVLLFQAVREALFNVAKYAGTDRAEVSLAEEDGALVITVADEGVGFDAEAVMGRPAGVAGGFGLRNARERLALFEGHLTVQSAPGRGTRVRLVVPVRRIRTEAP